MGRRDVGAGATIRRDAAGQFGVCAGPGLVVINWYHHIGFEFDPLPAGTQIHVRTDLVFVGGDLVTGSVPVQTGGNGVGSAQVLQSPTVTVPGPGAWVAGSFALVGLCGRRASERG